MLHYANAMLDMVKAFERVPHTWLVRQGERYNYPMQVLRLSIAAYKLGRCIVIDGICSKLLVAVRGITAGSVHATIELRLLLIEWLDDTVRLYRHITISVYVDDTSLESSGSGKVVEETVVGAVRYFTGALIDIGMDFSPTQNVVLVSHSWLATRIWQQLPGLNLKVVSNAKSLGGALSNGRRRNASVLAKRLKDFKVRKTQFQKLRKAIGARRLGTVLRSGGTAALVYGLGNTGVSNSMLYAQRSSVSAASVTGGRGDLDLSLMMADGSMSGTADPAFAAHQIPIARWAEAVWESWIPRAALAMLIKFAIEALKGRAYPWARVRGPGCAFVASAWRLGWTVSSHLTVVTDDGMALDLTRDSPAIVQRAVNRSVWRWRWRRVELRHPHLVQGSGGFGMLISPVFRLLNGRDGQGWGPTQKGALRSSFANRQWPQARLFQAGLVTSSNCRLCVAAGLCDAMDPNPRFTGHLTHRILSCQATEKFRRENAPKWILELAERCRDSNGLVTLDPADRDLLTRAILKSPEPSIDKPPAEATFEWVKRPSSSAMQASAYVDGSRLNAEHDLCGLCARQGWAIAAYDSDDNLVAAANGQVPDWAEGIHATELWGLLMALEALDPGCPIKVDCKAVQLGTLRDASWANAPCRTFARAWGPVANALEGDKARVVWMPAHSSLSNITHKRLSNGMPLRAGDVVGNDLVDQLAKRVARRSAMPKHQLSFVRSQATRLMEAAMWIGRATVFANHCPLESLTSVDPLAAKQFVRDSEASQPTRKARRRRQVIATPFAEVPLGNGTISVFSKILGKRKRSHPASVALTPADAAYASWRAKKARCLLRSEAEGDQKRLCNWLATRPPTVAPAVSASFRLAALRNRLATRVEHR